MAYWICGTVLRDDRSVRNNKIGADLYDLRESAEMEIGMKQIYSMNSGWRYRKQEEAGGAAIDDYFDMFKNISKTGAAADERGIAFYDGDWQQIDLPHDCSLDEPYAPENASGQGYKPPMRGWYRKSFTLDESFDGRKLFVKFEAIAVHSVIYMNGIQIAESHSAYTPILVEITDFYEAGKQNVLCVGADNFVNEGWWYEGCGIYGDVSLIAAETSYIRENGVRVVTEKMDSGDWNVRVSVELEAEEDAGELRVEYEFPELAIAKAGYACDCERAGGTVAKEAEEEIGKSGTKWIVQEPNAAGVYAVELAVCAPELWDPENPKLYRAVCRLYRKDELIDEQEVSFGFRTVTFDVTNGCVINGKPVKLKGVCLHHDHAGTGVAMPYDLQVYRLKKLKEMGCNAIRTSHNPQLGGFYKACDELGFLVMNEVRHFSSTEEALNQLRTFVRRDRNHPCVIMWSMFNEEPMQCTKIGAKMAASMKKLIMQEDGTRPVTGGMNGPFEAEGVRNYVDIMGFNYMQYGYDEFHKTYPELPIIGSETGSYLTTRYTANSTEDKTSLCSFGKERNKNLFQWSDTPGGTWKYISERPFVLGGFYWTGFDYKGESGNYPNVISAFGAMDLCGFPKDNFYWHKSLWREDAVMTLVPYYYEDSVRLNCYTNCEEYEVYADGEFLGSYQNDRFDPQPVMIKGTCRKLLVIGKNQGEECVRASAAKPGAPKYLRVETSDNDIRTDGVHVCVADIYMCDEEGNLVFDANDALTVKVEGGARLVGCGNGDRQSHVLDRTDTPSLFKGCCQVILQSNGRKEDAKLTIGCDAVGGAVMILRQEAAAPVPAIAGETAKVNLMTWRVSDVCPDYMTDDNIADAMFAWIPTTIGYGKSLMLSHKQGFGMILGNCIVPDPKSGKPVLVLDRILGKCDLYFNKTLVYQCEDGAETVRLTIPDELRNETLVVSLVFYLNGGEVGIPGEVYVEVI